MGTAHGSLAEVYYNGYDLSTFLNSFTLSHQADKADASTFKVVQKKYTKGLIDTTIQAGGWFDGTPQAIDDLMFAATSLDFQLWQYWPQGRVVGQPGYSAYGTETKYEAKSEIGATASITVEASGKQTDRGPLLAMDVTVSTTGNSATYDNLAVDTQPGVLIVHGTTTGSAMTVVLQDSADGTTFADVATANFSGGTGLDPAEQAYRVVTSANIRRYIRVRWSGAGTILTAQVGV